MCHHSARFPRCSFWVSKDGDPPKKKATVPFWLSFPLFEQTSRVLGCFRKTRPRAGEIVMTMCQLLCSLHRSVTDPLPLVSARYVQFNMHGCMCVCVCVRATLERQHQAFGAPRWACCSACWQHSMCTEMSCRCSAAACRRVDVCNMLDPMFLRRVGQYLAKFDAKPNNRAISHDILTRLEVVSGPPRQISRLDQPMMSF